MAVKTHLTAQEESVSESGVQLRNTEPATPVEGQVWIRTDQRRIKARFGGNTVVLSRGFSPSVEVTGTTIDASLADFFWKNITANTIFDITNILDGYFIEVMVYNTSLAQVEVSISNQTKWANGTNGLIPANSRKVFNFMRVGDNIVITPISYPA